MLRSLFTGLLVLLGAALASCSNGIESLVPYSNATLGYDFYYPNGWIEVAVDNPESGVDVAFRDLIDTTENVTVVINPVPEGRTLESLGSPTEVGYELQKTAIAPEVTGRVAELVDAAKGESPDQTYYKLEYKVTLPDGAERHNLASVAISRGRLYTLNVSMTERRWQLRQEMFETMAKSFKVY
ncbi:MAG: photosystem II reaction center PsbP [Cyanobacteria bacterium J06641_5]